MPTIHLFINDLLLQSSVMPAMARSIYILYCVQSINNIKEIAQGIFYELRLVTDKIYNIKWHIHRDLAT